MSHSRLLLLVLFSGLFPATGALAQARQVARVGCVLDFQDHYRCNRDAFQTRFAAARTVRIDTDRMDLFAHKRVQELMETLGKTVAAPEQRPDLVVDLEPINRSGRIELSPAAVALATLTVYDTSIGTGPRSRIWVETLDGDPDKPWPGIVTELLRKFRADALSH